MIKKNSNLYAFSVNKGVGSIIIVIVTTKIAIIERNETR
jgi:hypothetical protein